MGVGWVTKPLYLSSKALLEKMAIEVHSTKRSLQPNNDVDQNSWPSGKLRETCSVALWKFIKKWWKEFMPNVSLKWEMVIPFFVWAQSIV